MDDKALDEVLREEEVTQADRLDDRVKEADELPAAPADDEYPRDEEER